MLPYQIPSKSGPQNFGYNPNNTKLNFAFSSSSLLGFSADSRSSSTKIKGRKQHHLISSHLAQYSLSMKLRKSLSYLDVQFPCFLCVLLLLPLVTAANPPPTHKYTFHALQSPPPGTSAFEVTEGITSLHQCYTACNAYAVKTSPSKPCAGFTLVNSTGAYLCAYYHLNNAVTPNPPPPDLV